jgi:hypothetical protein
MTSEVQLKRIADKLMLVQKVRDLRKNWLRFTPSSVEFELKRIEEMILEI